MSANKPCTANFALNQVLLTVTTNGNGTVNSTSGGMTCSSSCTYPESLGSTITLRAAPATGSSFSGWSGAGCSGTGDCNITLSTNLSVAATFVESGSSPTDKIGVYRPSTGEWFLDVNGNGQWGDGDCGMVFCVSPFGSLNGVPVVGDLNGWGVSRRVERAEMGNEEGAVRTSGRSGGSGTQIRISSRRILYRPLSTVPPHSRLELRIPTSPT